MKNTVSVLVIVLSLLFTLSVLAEPAAGDRAADVVDLASEYGPDVPLAYYELSFRIVRRTAGFTPPVLARAYGYMGLALYESVVRGMPGHQSMAAQLNGIGPLPQGPPVPYHWPLVASASLAEVMRGLFGGATNASATNIADLDALEAAFETEFADVPPGLRRQSIAFGRSVGASVFETSKDDGAHEAYNKNFPAYTLPVGPGQWVPPSATARATQPYWGTAVTPFVLFNGAECDPGPPPEYSEDPSSEFYQEAHEVYLAVRNLTPEQLNIARFWGGINGPAHSLAIVNQILVQEGASLETSAETYAKVGIGVADAVIAVWWAKYHYNLLRPITYIRARIDPAWTSALPTPSFPEYVSAHSGQSAAAAALLESAFGESVAFVDHAADADGFAPRPYDRIFAFAEEAGISRIYGGIHFRSGNLKGQWQGRCVADLVDGLAWRR
jgi:hypothetical protein